MASEEAATDSGNAMRLQLSSRTVSVGAGGPAVEQLAEDDHQQQRRRSRRPVCGIVVALPVRVWVPRHDRSESRLDRPCRRHWLSCFGGGCDRGGCAVALCSTQFRAAANLVKNRSVASHARSAAFVEE